MVKRILKRIFVFSSVACLVLACLPSVSFAIDPVSGAAALAGAIDAYGMAYGVGTVYDVSSSSGVSSSFEGLWDDFSEYQSNAGSQFDYDSYIENYNQNRSLYGFEHSSGKFAAWSIDAESAQIFDQFWNWLLTGPAEMTRVDNEYFQFSQSQIGPDAQSITVGTFNSSPWYGTVGPYVSASDYASIYSLSTPLMTISNSFRYCSKTSGAVVYAFFIPDGSSYQLIGASSTQNAKFYMIKDTYTVNDFLCTNYSSGIYYYAYHSYSPVSVSVPVFSSLQDGLSSLASFLVDPTVTESSIGVQSHSDTGIVSLPDPYGQDYIPVPLEIVTNIPWDSSYDDTDEEDGSPVPFPPVDVPFVVDDIISAISDDTYDKVEEINDPLPPPTEVILPFIPVELPSFNFSFSGIWHYVREWVSSLGAWFTTLFTIWSALPYAMVVPVYATAVVVIVLGVYKRFFM